MDYTLFKQKLRSILGIDLDSYKEQQMHRRILQWNSRHRLESFADLVKKLEVSEEHRQRFAEYLTINTSHFFRDQAVFENIDKQILPDVFRRNRRPKIWSAGCSIGAEVYSLALLLVSKGWTFPNLLATDIDQAILAKAKEGIYLANQLSAVPEKLLTRYFVKLDNQQWQLKSEVRDKVTFARQDLIKDPFGVDFDLILCRNVFIYFTNETQKSLTERFVAALQPDGYFIVGSAEQIMNPARFGLSRVSYCIYQKVRRE